MNVLIAVQNKAQGGWDFVTIATFVAIILFCIIALMVFLAFQSLGKYWMQAFTSGCPIAFPQLLAMHLRKVKPGDVIPHGIAAAQAGFPILWRELESAYLQGTDLKTVTTAYVASMEREQGFSFQDLVNADRDSRLKEMLNNG
ncbi:MAG: flotillin-like FloA family protein [Mariniblastus sp.]